MHNRKDEILDDLRQKILSEAYAQGQSLIERELCEYYSISRTPIREILWRLVLDGIVEQRPTRGFNVRSLGWEQIFEIFQTREAIEGMASRLTCLRQDREIIERLKQLKKALVKMPAKNVAKEGPAIGRVLHQTIIEGSSNSLLGEIYEKIGYMAKLTSNIAQKSTTIETDSREDHIAVIDAIIEGNADTSEQVMREHLRITCRNIIDTFYPQVFSSLRMEKAQRME